MTRGEAIERIATTLPQLSDERVQILAARNPATRAAIAEGMAEARRGEFATDEEVAEAFARFHKRR